MVSMREQIKTTFESIVIVAIILVLVQTFFEDFASVSGWSWNVQRIFVISGFVFDLFFTIEFLARFYTSVFQGKAAEYFVRRRGWIDFAASIPLLLLSSGPALITVITGSTMAFAMGSILNILKVVKAIRIARVLRLLRVLKIFKQIKYTDSLMAQRHIAKITTVVVTLFVFVVFIATIISDLAGVPSFEDIVDERYSVIADDVTMIASGSSNPGSAVSNAASRHPDLLLVKLRGDTIYTRYDNDVYETEYGPNGYWYYERGAVELFFDSTKTLKMQARDNLVYFAMIILLVAFLLVYYSPHFALTISDPIHVMRKGMEDPSYNFEVKIPERFESDDIFRLAQAYNAEFLPLKDRNQRESEPSSSLLDFDDVKTILEEPEE